MYKEACQQLTQLFVEDVGGPCRPSAPKNKSASVGCCASGQFDPARAEAQLCRLQLPKAVCTPAEVFAAQQCARQNWMITARLPRRKIRTCCRRRTDRRTRTDCAVYLVVYHRGGLGFWASGHGQRRLKIKLHYANAGTRQFLGETWVFYKYHGAAQSWCSLCVLKIRASFPQGCRPRHLVLSRLATARRAAAGCATVRAWLLCYRALSENHCGSLRSSPAGSCHSVFGERRG